MKQLLLFFSSILALHAVSQSTQPVTLTSEGVEAEQKTDLPFNVVRVIDVRFDKSNIGCVEQNVSGNSIKHNKTIAIFPDSLQNYLPNLLTKFIGLDNSSKDTLVLLVKQFRLTEKFFHARSGAYEPELFLKLSVSVFRLRDMQMTKLYSVNDLLSQRISTDKKPRKDVVNLFRVEALLKILQKAFSTNIWQVNTGFFAFSSVEEGIRKRFQLPVLQDSMFKYGIYKTFQEFKQNNPSITNIKFEVKNNVVNGIVDSVGKPLDAGNFWGLCDGKNRYIVFRNQLCKLLPSDRSFCFLSYAKASDLDRPADFGSVAPQAGVIPALFAFSDPTYHEYFYLNMDEEVVHLEEIFGKSGLKEMQKEVLK